MWLGSLNNSAGRQGNTLQGEYAGMHLSHSIRRVWRGHYLVEQIEERNGIRPFKVLSILPDVNSSQLLILALTPQPAPRCTSTHLHTPMHTHTHTHRGNSAHDWGELSPWTWTGGPWGGSSPILMIWALLATLTQVLKQGGPSQPKVPIPTTNSSKDWPVAGYMGRGLKPQDHVSPSCLLLKGCPLTHWHSSSWQPEAYQLKNSRTTSGTSEEKLYVKVEFPGGIVVVGLQELDSGGQ